MRPLMGRLSIPGARFHSAVPELLRPNDVGWRVVFTICEVMAMRKSLIALVAASSVGMAAVTMPTTAEARYWGRGWGWGLGGFALGAAVGSALARPYYG